MLILDPCVASFPQMLQGLLAPLLLAASAAVVAAMPEQCTSEMNKIKDLLEVSCVEMGLTSIPSELPKDTGILLLASNQLSKVALASFQHLSQLSVLDLSNNSLRTLETGAALPKLHHLLLSHNGLESLPAFPGLPSLKCLELGHNQLSQLPEGGFRDLGQLEDLQLQGNRLRSLPGGAFKGLPMLNDLDLSDNLLEELPQELLAELYNLTILRLERNRLEWVPDDFFSGDMYQFIYLVGNPWRCDCRLKYLRDWINDNEINVYTRMTIKKDGVDKEVMEIEPHKVLCQAPPKVRGQPVMDFQAACRKLGDVDQEEEEEEGGPASDSWTPSPTTSTATAAPTLPLRAASSSSRSPSTSISSTGAALTTTSSTSALSSTMTTHSATTTSPVPTTTINILTTTAAFVTFGLSTSGATVGRSTATSSGPMTTPGLSTSPNPHIPTTMATSGTRLALSPTASMLTTSLPSSPPLMTTAARHPPSPVALVPSTPTPVKSSPGISASLSTWEFSPPKPTVHCLCPALPVRVLGVAARKGSNAEWLADSCCLLRLVLYLTCLALVALPTLALLCWLGWLYFGWYRPALQEAPGPRLARPQSWQEAPPQERQLEFAESPRPTSGPHIYRVCKKFQVASSRHVTWLLVSLPGSAGKWAQLQARLSSYSLDRGTDTLGAVSVKYATASL